MKKLFTGLAAGLAVCLLPLGASAQSVTVHSDGVSGDFQYLAEAVDHVMADTSGPDIITLLDVGPHITTGALIIDGDDPAPAESHTPSPFTLRGDPALLPERPRLVLQGSGNGSSSAAIFLRQNGDTTLQNLVLLYNDVSRPGNYVRWNFTDGPTAANPVNVTIDNVLVTSRMQGEPIDGEIFTDDGFNLNREIPAARLDMWGPHRRAFWIGSTNPANVNSVTITDTVVSVLPSDSAIRIELDGAPGSEINIGEGVVLSYLMRGEDNPSQATGTEWALDLFRTNIENGLNVQGTDTNPVQIFNNPGPLTYGIAVDIDGASTDPTMNFEHVIIANNGAGGFLHLQGAAGDSSGNMVINNSTIANNGGPAIVMGGGTNWTSGTLTADNLIVAGNGTTDAENVIAVAGGTGPEETAGTATFTNSAIVLNGDYALTGDGFAPASPSNVTLTNVINDDPGFYETESGTGTHFYRAGAAAYSNATPPVTGAWDSNVATVNEWLMLD